MVHDFNLIRFLTFYFALMFFFGLMRRFKQYRSIGELVLTGPTRWPNLLKLIREHRYVFMSWSTFAPLILALGVWMVQFILARFVWPQAAVPPSGLTLGVLLEHWQTLFVVIPVALAMFGVDLYFLIRAGAIPKEEMEKHFNQAEYWLASPTASVVRVVTFGIVNPRQMVRTEVQKALISASGLLNANLWWWNLQVTLRLICGAVLWSTWALTHE